MYYQYLGYSPLPLVQIRRVKTKQKSEKTWKWLELILIECAGKSVLDSTSVELLNEDWQPSERKGALMKVIVCIIIIAVVVNIINIMCI